MYKASIYTTKEKLTWITQKAGIISASTVDSFSLTLITNFYAESSACKQN